MFEQVAIVGFGLIGGSVALAAKARRLASRVVGIDALVSSAAREIADEIVEITARDAMRRTLASSDLVVLATPVASIETMLAEVLEHARLTTDCGSTKRAIVRAARLTTRSSRFVPGHPMAGDPRSGVDHARADLFEDRIWILCPEESDPGAVEILERFVRGLGASPLRMSAEVHDRAVAITSHAPQLLASVLLVLASKRQAGIAAGPAFESATRVAGGNDAMWRDILATNSDEIAIALREIAVHLETIAKELESEPPRLRAALELIEQARRVRPPR